MKNIKQSEKILTEIIKLYPFLEKTDITEASESKLQKLANKLQEPRFLSWKINKKLEELEAKRKQSEFLKKKFS